MKRFVKLLTILLVAIFMSAFAVPGSAFALHSKIKSCTNYTSIPIGYEFTEFLSKKPFIVTGSLSEIKSEAKELGKISGLKGFYDTNLLSKKPFLILVGENYTNLLTLLLELNKKTPINVTKDYPGKGIGVVEYLDCSAENIYGDNEYMEIVILTGSDKKGTLNAIRYFEKFISGDKTLSFSYNSGVVFVDSKLNTMDIQIREVPLSYKDVKIRLITFLEMLKNENVNIIEKIFP